MSFLASVRRILDAIQTTQVMSKQSFTQTEYCLNFSPRAKTSLCSFSVHFREVKLLQAESVHTPTTLISEARMPYLKVDLAGVVRGLG